MNKENFLELIEEKKPKYTVTDWINKGQNLSEYVQTALDAIDSYIENENKRYLAVAYNVIKNVRLFLSDEAYYNIEKKFREKTKELH